MKKSILFAIVLQLIVNIGNAQIKTEPLSIGEKFELYSEYNKTKYQISVCLPKDYSKDSANYACVYLFYGGDSKFLAASGIITSLSDATWQIPHVIIVGVTNMQWQRDLTPVPIRGRENCGGAKEFLSFVSNDLFPAIDSNYRTSNHRIFMGHSFGGLFGIYSFIENPEYFDDFILISPSIAQRADYIQNAFKEKVQSSENLNNKFYLSSGSEGPRILKSVLWIEEGLESKRHENIRWRFEQFEGHNHHTQTSLTNKWTVVYI